ncbi:FlgO family outer membrane protein [uncultured Paraglaciecola sp.]|uniref:FlgO family outer membrane protein n=1 Tax=uncultured Paraglaciecola sp. TaxID=1765024 RepID=UPI0030DA71F6
MRIICLMILLGASVSGCAMTDLMGDNNDDLAIVNATTVHPSNSLHGHVEKLARQLLSTSQFINTSNTIAIGTILPTMHSSGEPLPTEMALGLQIQESLMTFVTQAGLKVVEYKTMPNIKISEHADKMLSRQVNELTPSITADYFLTGTYTLQENSTMVNIRLIQVPENIVLAAATDYVPNDAMWSATKVNMKHNQIYRNSY